MRAAEEDLERPGGGKGYVIESVGLESKSDSELAREEWEAEFTVLVAAFWWTSPLEVGDERVLLQAPCSLWIRLSRHWLGAWFWEVWGSLEDWVRWAGLAGVCDMIVGRQKNISLYKYGTMLC